MDTCDKRGYDSDAEFAGLCTRGCAAFGDGGGYHVKQSVNRWSRVALAAVLTGALGLAGCGRKGPLDPPPNAGLAQNTTYAPMPSLGETHYGVPPGAATAPPPPAAAAVPAPASAAPPVQQRTFFLDFLLGK
jgi:predicted small lipoprotein YifL